MCNILGDSAETNSKNEGQLQCGEEKDQRHRCSTFRLAIPLDWLWDERFDYLFVGIIKIIELPQGVD